MLTSQVNDEKNTVKYEDPSGEGLNKYVSVRCPDQSNMKKIKKTVNIAMRISVHGDHYW